jgi:integrase
MAFLMTMRRMKLAAVPHGFRSSFRDWASEQTHFPHEVCEMALAHAIRSKTEPAYRRGDLLSKRRELYASLGGLPLPTNRGGCRLAHEF